MFYTIEYDDGKPIDLDRSKRSPHCTPRGRDTGFYLRAYNEDKLTYRGEEQIKIGYMRVSEMAGLASLINRAVQMPKADVAQLVEQRTCNAKVGGSNPSVGSRLREFWEALWFCAQP
jgi:hypothetical protein